MNKLTTLAIIGVLSHGTACMAMASGSDDSTGPMNNDPNATGIIVIETVAYTDTCAQDPKSPCVKDGICACKDKTKCQDCKAHLKKCDAATQAKCQKALKDGTMTCPSGKTCPKDPSNAVK